MDRNLEELLNRIETAMKERALGDLASGRIALLAAYLIRSRLNLRAIALLSKNSLHSETVALLRPQLDLRVSSLILCSGIGEYATRWLKWHDELRRRLKFLNLEHLEAEAPHMSALLTQTRTADENQLLTDWYKAKPQPAEDEEEWLSHWPTWSLEKKVREVKKNLVDDPRLKKELENLAAFVFENPLDTGFSGGKRYALVDDELKAVTFVDSGEIHWPEGPVTLALAAIVDMLAEINAAFALPFHDEIEQYRLKMKPSEF